MITDEILKKIKEEIAADPQELGYLGKTDDEVAKLLSDTVYKSRVVIDASPSPLNRILDNIKDSPNVVTKEDVSASKTK